MGHDAALLFMVSDGFLFSETVENSLEFRKFSSVGGILSPSASTDRRKPELHFSLVVTIHWCGDKILRHADQEVAETLLYVHGSCKCLSATRASVFLQLVQVFFCNSCKRFSATRAGIFPEVLQAAGRLPEVLQVHRLPEVLRLFTSNYLVTVCFRLQAFFRKSCRQTSGSPVGLRAISFWKGSFMLRFLPQNTPNMLDLCSELPIFDKKLRRYV